MVEKFFGIKPDISHKICVGKQGSCKDLLIVSWVFDEYRRRGCKVYSVGELFGIDYVRVRCFDDLLNARGDPDNVGIVYWHDMDLEFDSRSSMRNTSKQTKLLFIVNQLRKRNLVLYGSIHRINSIDVKVRSLIRYWVVPEKLYLGDLFGGGKSNMYNYMARYTIFDEYGLEVGKGFLSGADMVRYCVCYNTYEEIGSILDDCREDVVV